VRAAYAGAPVRPEKKKEKKEKKKDSQCGCLLRITG